VYAHLFPKFAINKNGSRFVYDFGVAAVPPISLEKEHGSREYIPKHFAKLAFLGIDDL
jgi:hypothetical protein